MTVKQQIVETIMRDVPTAFQLNDTKLGDMVDEVMAWIHSGQHIKSFLIMKGAINENGDVLKDLQVSSFDKDSKQNITSRLAFKYPVYTKIASQLDRIVTEIREKETARLAETPDAQAKLQPST